MYFMFLFINDLFHDSDSSSEYIVSNKFIS
jgi:hypothetical protein